MTSNAGQGGERIRKIVLADEVAVRRIAKIIGPCSAADLALAELDMRRRTGQDVAIFQTVGSWIVGPAPTSNSDEDGRSNHADGTEPEVVEKVTQSE